MAGIGIRTMDAILAVTDELAACVAEDFGSNEGVYRINDRGDYVTAENWESV